MLASKNTGSGCQLLLCEFFDNGSPIPSNGLNSTSYAFFTAGTHIVAAGCECSPCDLLGDDTVTINVTACGTGVSLQTETVATIPANRARSKLGVGERVVLRLNPAPPCPVQWSVSSGPGSLSATSGSSVTFTAHTNASSSTVTANFGGTSRSAPFTVVEPSFETATILSTDTYPAGTQGAGMVLDITVNPTDVSFRNVEMLELPGPATNIYGYFTQFAPASLAHSPNPNWVQLSDVNRWGDHAWDSGEPKTCGGLPTWCLGGYEWDIPVRWRVINTAPQGSVQNRLQQVTITGPDGTTTIQKLGRSVTRTP